MVPLTANGGVRATAPAHISVEGTASGQVIVGRTFELVYESAQRDISRLDAQQIRLRLFELVADQEEPLYTQFVSILPVPSPDLRRFVGADPNVTEGRLWSRFAAIRPRLVGAVKRGNIPTATPSFAYELSTYDLGAAVRQARQDSDPNHEVKVNEVIYTSQLPSLGHTRRRARLQCRSADCRLRLRNPATHAGRPASLYDAVGAFADAAG